MIRKGDKFKIDRFRNGEFETYKVERLCRRFITVSNEKHKWAMPYDRLKDIQKDE